MSNTRLQGGSQKPEVAIHLHIHDKGILPKIGHQIVVVYDWLSGPPMSEHDRLNRELAETETLRQLSNRSF